MAVYIYGLRCPVTGAIKYIGKSDDPDRRFKAHLSTCRRDRTHKARWLFNLTQKGMEPALEIIREVADGEDWAAAECEEIARALSLGWPLTNMTEGGEGVPLDPASRAAKALAMSKPETRARMSQAARARWADPEKGAKGRAENGSPERRKILSKSARERATPEYRAMMAERSKAAWSDSAKRKKIEAGITDEVKRKVSASSKEFWATNPNADKCRMNLQRPTQEMIEKASRARQTPEAIERRRVWMSSPEYREKLSLALKASWERRRKG